MLKLFKKVLMFASKSDTCKKNFVWTCEKESIFHLALLVYLTMSGSVSASSFHHCQLWCWYHRDKELVLHLAKKLLWAPNDDQWKTALLQHQYQSTKEKVIVVLFQPFTTQGKCQIFLKWEPWTIRPSKKYHFKGIFWGML